MEPQSICYYSECNNILNKKQTKFCSRSCRSKMTMKTLLLKHPNLASKGGKRTNKLHPNLFSSNLTKQNIYRNNHDGRSRTEEYFWTNSPELKLLGLQSQYKEFHKVGRGGPILDFCIPTHKLCIELDGWGHDPIKDKERDQWLLNTHGWKTLRFNNKEVKNNIKLVINKIKDHICMLN